jgi:tol-pal system beta propeller repeat protein TolB
MQRFARASAVYALFALATLTVNQAAAEDKPQLTVATTRFGDVQLMTIDIDGQNAVQLTKDPKGASQATWSPDGKHLAFISFRNGPGQIFVMDADGVEEKNITNDTTSHRTPVWSPDGKKILFATSTATGNDVALIDPDGSNRVNLTNRPSDDCDPFWSPDSKRIVFVCNPTGLYRIHAMNADGTQSGELLNEGLRGAAYPAWSSDGQQIVFGGPGEAGTVQLFVINTDGSNKQQITRDKLSCSYATWSPDGQYIAYIRFTRWPYGHEPPGDNPPSGDLLVYDLVSGEHKEVSKGDISMWGPRPSWKPKPGDGAAQ